jgi:IS5 family transposase
MAAKKGATALEQPSKGKDTKMLAVSDSSGFPLTICTASASPHEIKLVDTALEAKFVKAKPKRLIGDKAYDSDPLDKKLKAKGIELIAPHKNNRVKPPTQNGRALRRYKRRWKVEQLFSWMQNFRRLVVRYEYYVENLLGFIHLVCILILLRRYL